MLCEICASVWCKDEFFIIDTGNKNVLFETLLKHRDHSTCNMQKLEQRH